VAVGGALVLAFGAASLIAKAADYHKILHALESADEEWFPLCLGAQIVRYLGYIAAYRDVAQVDKGPRLPFRLTAKIVAAGFGAAVVGTGAGTLAVDYWALRRAGATRDGAIARVLGLNTLEWAVLGSAATLSALAILIVRDDVPLGATVPWLVVVPLCVVAGAWVSSPRRSGRFTSLGGGRIRGLLSDAIVGVMLLRRLRIRPTRDGGWGVAGVAGYWLGDIVCLWGALHAFGVDVGTPELVLAYATGYAATILPLPAGGAGGIEAAMTYALTLAGVPLVPALLGAVVYRFFTFWLPLVPGLLVLPFLRQLREELPATR
jgi:uncharacterized membrane protein YbhN (UPF0104 family)